MAAPARDLQPHDTLDEIDLQFLRERQIIRDVSGLEWDEAWLTRHFEEMVDREGTALSRLLDLSNLNPADAAEALMSLFRLNPAAAADLIGGYIDTAGEEIRKAIAAAADPASAKADYDAWLVDILPFHAFECAQLAADDAHRRYHHALGLPSLEKPGATGTKAGYPKNQMLHQVQALKQVIEIHERSPDKASDKDTARLDRLGMADVMMSSEMDWRKAHGRKMPALVKAHFEEGRALMPQIEATLAEFEKTPGHGRAPADVASGDPALAQFWPVCASMAAFCIIEDSKGRTGPLALAVDALLKGSTPSIPTRAETDAMLPGAMHRAYRMTIIHDDRELPKLYVQEAEKRRGSGDDLWEPPVTFDKVYTALARMKASPETFLISDFAKQAKKTMDAADAEPDTPENARGRLEAQGRLWFRLRL